jgi:exodeoxyribonuclease III
VKIATWNVNSLRVRLEHVSSWLTAHEPDVLALQETKVPDEEFPAKTFEALGYRSVCNGQRAYNGVAIVTRLEPADVVTTLEDLDDAQRRVLGMTLGELRLYNLYVPNGQSVESEKYVYKLEWLEALRGQLARELERHERVAVVGDFNIAPDDRDVHDPAAWEGKVHCTPAERAALQRIMNLGFHDAFRLIEQPERAFTWWDYRAAAFRRNLGLRIDLILCSEALRSCMAACHIDVAPRRLERPSDHAPVVAVFS